MVEQNQPTFEMVVEALLDASQPFPPRLLHRLSDLTPDELARLREIWPQVGTERRVSLMEDLEDLTDVDTLVFFDDIARFALEDEEPRVRASAIRLLFTADDPKLALSFVRMMRKDPDVHVRAAAANALGNFVYYGELEEIPAETLEVVENALIAVMGMEEDSQVKRWALESLGYSSRPEVPPLIRLAFARADLEWKASALCAMGRSADKVWAETVLAHVDSSLPELQFEAVRAAGQLELAGARRPLLDLLEEPLELDEDVYLAAVWSLSQIGGQGVRERLDDLLEDSDDEEVSQLIQDALDNLEFTEGLSLFDMMDVEPEEEEELSRVIDLEEDGADLAGEDEGFDEAEDDEEPRKPTPRKRHRHQ
ncbi:HEAT repeat domain-containing protein [Levilinea saccharolytica]|uniref:HEAT repeat domain-containing protein n=1 Tax=Levilinea saccharolytica TaxID=229921 RepID=A0A0P6Z3D4_9CHLR|nr:HEAT repeat domain-containing protein [Levilinea saccharolytica]KPL91751.1 hypothetical protein ADN01_00175 [Levilinea saccharolytica]GAP17544.1 protein containing FOG: HEAT repeat [Levilinea saccharolytica]